MADGQDQVTRVGERTEEHPEGAATGKEFGETKTYASRSKMKGRGFFSPHRSGLNFGGDL